MAALLPPGEGGPKGRMRDLQALKIPHPTLSGVPLPEDRVIGKILKSDESCSGDSKFETIRKLKLDQTG
jgi:hypothetical protein